MRIVISGASGMIGTALMQCLEQAESEVIRLVRREPISAAEVRWDPSSGYLNAAALSGADAIVNLSGASLSRLPWTPRRRTEIVRSRVRATETLVTALHELHDRGETVPALVSGSAVGFYGSRPDENLTEASAPGVGFLSDVVCRWEKAALSAPSTARVVLARTGIVLGAGGALRPLRRAANLGLAGPVGGGHQYWPWISLRDEAAALAHLTRSALSGPVNVVGPVPATATELVQALAREMHRPYWLPLPAVAVKAVLGQAGRELLLADQRVLAEALLADGFNFQDATVVDAISNAQPPDR